MKVIPGKGVWTVLGELYLAKKGLKLRSIANINRKQLYAEGDRYFVNKLGEETANYYIHSSNFSKIQPQLKDHIDLIPHEERKATVDDIIDALKNNCLVGAQINARILNNKQGFSLHYVLIYSYMDDCFMLHDPGLPPLPARRVSRLDFENCFDYDGADPAIIIFGEL